MVRYVRYVRSTKNGGVGNFVSMLSLSSELVVAGSCVNVVDDIVLFLCDNNACALLQVRHGSQTPLAAFQVSFQRHFERGGDHGEDRGPSVGVWRVGPPFPGRPPPPPRPAGQARE